MVPEHVIQKGALILLLGDMDTGKTTLCRHLVARGLQRGWKVGVVDADVGQSWIGPPTTIGMRLLTETPSYDPPHGLYFVGWISPENHLAEMLVGTKVMVDRCWKMGADMVLVDTTGLVVGEFGVYLKLLKIDLLRPSHIIAIQRSSELRPILKRLGGHSEWVCPMAPAPGVEKKSRDQRREYREHRLRRYFASARLIAVSFDRRSLRGCILGGGRPATAQELEFLAQWADVRVHYAEWSHRGLIFVPEKPLEPRQLALIRSQLSRPHVEQLAPETYQGRMVGLDSTERETIGLGIIRSIRWSERQLILQTPVSAEQIRTIRMGRFTWNPLESSLDEVNLR